MRASPTSHRGREPVTAYFGSCLCGSAKFEVQGEFDSFYLCHCQHCQKDTGSAHAANLFSQSAKVTWLSGSDSVTTFTLPGTRHSKSFCKVCGSALPGTHGEGLLVIPAGCLDTEVSMLPTAHIFTSSKAVWDTGSESLPKFEGLPD
ncbi:GFA family protein [Pseudohalioglobus sediminis]|uniref:GFA family protein n=1 Tax=Pseudohalioglobus sediminis TaxID=2606449 RepID=UPI0021CFF0E5|nr:GFA family protein [Pseudohalioglobus sediminis]